VFFAQSLKSVVWVAASTVTNGVRQFGTPVEYNINCRGLTAVADMMAFGPRYLDYRRSVMANELAVNFHELDRVWIGKTPTNPADVFASDANFYVESVIAGAGGVAQIMFRKLTPDA